MSNANASRVLSVIDERIEQATRSAAGVELTWGTVAAITSPYFCAVYVRGDSAYSEGFHIFNGVTPSVGDPVMVAIDKRGNRWIDAVPAPTSGYNKLEINPRAGTIKLGDGASAPSSYLSGESSRVNVHGPLAVTGAIASFNGDTANSYTPTVGGGGTATFTTQSGKYWKIGKLVFVRIYITVNVAGSGATQVSITTPSTPARSGVRQVLTGNAEGFGGLDGTVSLVSFSSGSGATWDRLRTDDGVDFTGANLLSSGILTIQGVYEEA